MSTTTEPTADREQTDESLRVEREKADDVLEEVLSAIDVTADAIIGRARQRADRVLAAARARADRRAAAPVPSTMVERERERDDRVLLGERDEEDDTRLEERAEQVALISLERDETDKDLLSERARSDVALSMRDEFLGVVSHDLRNMLQAVVGFASMIEQDVTGEIGPVRVVAHAQRIQRAGARMERLIGDLVDVASIEAGTLAVTREVSEPAQVVTEAIESFQPQAAKGGVSLMAEMMPLSSPAAFDPARILQVLTNLLGNAIKFTPAGGDVIVRVEQIDDAIRFTVTDTGAGIPGHELEAVFERFHQSNKGDRRGVGLGLYISRCIVHGHGGRIWAENRTPVGSRFSFELPVHTAAASVHTP